MDDINKLIEILKNCEQEHRDLDEILISLQEKNTVDFLHCLLYTSDAADE